VTKDTALTSVSLNVPQMRTSSTRLYPTLLVFLAAAGQSVAAQGQAPSTDVCARIKASAVISTYVRLIDEYTEEDERRYPSLDTEDKLVKQWVESQLSALSRSTGGEETLNVASTKIEQCAWELRDDERIILFANSWSELSNLRKKLDAIVPPPKAPIRTIDANGNVATVNDVEMTVDWRRQRRNVGHYDGTAQYYYQCMRMKKCEGWVEPFSNFPFLLAYALPGGEKVIEALGDELLGPTEKYVRFKENERTARAARIEQQNAANARDSAKAAAESAETAAYYRELRAGNFQKAKSCLDVALAYDEVQDVYNGVTVVIEPTNEVHYVLAPLKQFETNDVLKTTTGTLQSGNAFVKFNATRSTHWIDRSSIGLNANVVIVGKYVANAPVTLTTGATTKAAVLTAICVGTH